MDNEKVAAYILLGLGGLGILVGLGFQGFVPLIGGGVSMALGLRKLGQKNKKLPSGMNARQLQDFKMDDKMIIRLAKRKGGKLTVAELSRQTSLTPQQAKERLEQFHLQGKTDLHVTDDGVIVYEFIES